MRRRRATPPRRPAAHPARQPIGGPPKKARRLSLTQGILLAAAVVTILAGTLGLVSALSPASSSRPPQHTGAVILTAAYVKNPEEAMYIAANGQMTQTLESTPTIETLVHNETAHRVLITAVAIRIEAFANMHVCFSQGAGPIASPSPYVIPLPLQPQPGEAVIHHRLAEQIGPEEPDRIALRFAPMQPPYGYAIYRIHLQLLLDTGAPLDAGDFVIALPGSAPSYGTFLPEDNILLTQLARKEFRPAVMPASWCFKHNLAMLHALLSGPGQRVPALQALDPPVIASRWPALERMLSPRTDAMKLLAAKSSELAAFAASETHDQRFAERVRASAVRLLLSEAAEELSQGPSSAGEQKVRTALVIAPSALGRELLARFQRRLGTYVQ